MGEGKKSSLNRVLFKEPKKARLGARYLRVSNAVSNDAADVTSLLYFGNEVTIDSFCVTSLQWWLSPIAGSLLRYSGGYRR